MKRLPPAGAPLIYSRDKVLVAERVCMLGATEADLAAVFGVTTMTLNRWKHKYPEFADACDRGKAAVDEMVVKSLFMRATGYTFDSEKIFLNKAGRIVRAKTREHAIPDVFAAVFWLKNRQPDVWREKQHVQFSGAVAGAASKIIDDIGDVATVSDEVLARVYADAVNPQTLEKVASESRGSAPPTSGAKH